MWAIGEGRLFGPDFDFDYDFDFDRLSTALCEGQSVNDMTW